MPVKRLFLLVCVFVIMFGTTGSLEQNNSSFQNLGVNVSQPSGDLPVVNVQQSWNPTDTIQDQDFSTRGVDEGNQTFLTGTDPEIIIGGCLNESIQAQGFIQSSDDQRSPNILTQQDSDCTSTSGSGDLKLNQKGGKEKPSHAEDELIIRFNYEPGKKMDTEIADKAHKNASAQAKKNSKVKEDFSVKKDFNEKGLSGIQVVKIPEGMTVDEAIALYTENPDVLSAEMNYLIELMEIPNDPDLSLQWGLLNAANNGSDINAVSAWNITNGNGGVIIAIPDTGIDTAHPDLADNLWSNTGDLIRNGIDDDGNGYIDDIRGWDFVNDDADPTDDNGHGTHVAGIAGAAGNNGIGITGVMWDARILPLKVIGPDGYGYESDAIEAVLYARQAGAQVISISWGSYGESQALKEAIDSYPGLVVCAAGNSGRDNDLYPVYPASYPSGNVISVTATDERDEIASFGNYGMHSVDIAAPGVGIYSTVPWSGYEARSGTSMAAPFVAGVAGLVLSVNGDLGGEDLVAVLYQSSDTCDSLEGRVSSSGRVNAEAALLLARGGYVPAVSPSQTIPIPTGTVTPTPAVTDNEPQAAPPNDEFLRYVQMGTTHSTEAGDGEHGTGYFPSPVNMTHVKGQILEFSDISILSLPSSYDLQDVGRVTPVKDQGNCGSCWAHGAMASLESTLMPNATWNFNEWHLNVNHGFDVPSCEGGNNYMSTAYLTRWSGPMSEGQSSPVRKHVQEILIIPAKTSALDNENIKNAIINYGGISASFNVNSAYFNGASYYYPSSGSSNHMVTIVGWDDTYPADNFKTRPAGNGAYLCKNSWGTDWGLSGYFWISYYDGIMGYDELAVFKNAEPVVKYDHVYQYDPLGWVGSVGYRSNTAWAANVFRSARNEQVLAAGFYALSPNTAYQVFVYRNPSNGPVNSQGYAAYQSGIIAMPGYHTIPLNTPVNLAAGEKFSIVVKLTTPGYNYPIAYEYPYPGYSSAARAAAGQSYIRNPGDSWKDITAWKKNSNVCVKGYTGFAYDAAFVSETIPARMYACQTYNVAVTMRNKGAFPWSKDDNIVLRGRYPATFAFLESIYFRLPEATVVNPGEKFTFNIQMTAPDTIGTHHTEFKMIDLDDANWFGALVVQEIKVQTPVYNAALVSETIPARMYAGQTYNVAVTMRNNGAFAWSREDNIVLRGRYPATFAFLESIYFRLPEGTVVNPGEQFTFNIQMTAPDTIGTHHTEFKMIDLDDANWFGALVVQEIQVEDEE